MSLVFLKNETTANNGLNDTHLLPYDWTNHFASPFILPPNSQVAFVSATMNRLATAQIEEPNNKYWLQIGIPSLNRAVPQFLTTGNDDWNDILNELALYLNYYAGQTEFMSDTIQSPYLNGWAANINIPTQKITLKCKQRLQPNLYGLQLNTSRNPTAGIVWNERNELGATFRNAPDGICFFNPIVPDNLGVNPAVRTSCGSARIWTQNGQVLGTPSRYGQNTWAMYFSNTGIKRSMGNPIGGSWGTGMGGAAVMQINLSSAADGATARSQVPNIITGVQSLQFIKGNEADEFGGFEGFVNNLDINTQPTKQGGQSNSRYVFGATIDRQILTIERQQASAATPDVGDLPALGACGNSRHSIVHQLDLNNWVNDTTAAGAPQPEPILGAAFGNNFQLRFRWTTPYCIAIEGSTNFNQDLNTGDWFLLYDSSTGDTPAGAASAPIQYIPSWFGDMSLVIYSQNRTRNYVYGCFDLIKAYGAGVAPYPNYEQSLTSPGEYNGTQIIGAGTRWFKTIEAGDLPPAGVPEVFDANGYASKEINLVLAPITNTPVSVDKFDCWKPAYAKVPRFIVGTPETQLGVLMGFLNAGDDGAVNVPLDVAGDYENYGKEGDKRVEEDNKRQSIHIQLTDLPIQSRNGVSSQQVADIAVVHNWGDGGTIINGNLTYQHYSFEKNWIDLNNIGEMTLNRLRVYLSYDDNKPAVNLIGKTDILIMFRKKPSTDTSLPNQPIGVDYQQRSNRTRLM